VKEAEAFRWRRHLVLVKRPDYLVVWDEISSPMASEWFLHTTANRFEWEPHCVTCRTAYNADLDVHVLSPVGRLAPNEKAGPFGSWEYDNPRVGKEDSYPFTKLNYFSIPARPDEHFLTVLHPRKPGGTRLQATLLESPKESVWLQVMLNDRTDLVKLAANGGSFQRSGFPAVLLPMYVDGNMESNTRTAPLPSGE
jgi:hypothetical protein